MTTLLIVVVPFVFAELFPRYIPDWCWPVIGVLDVVCAIWWFYVLFVMARKKRLDADCLQNNALRVISKEVAEKMHDKSLSYDDIVKVLYSIDNAKRYVILKNNNGTFKYIYEELILYDENVFY